MTPENKIDKDQQTNEQEIGRLSMNEKNDRELLDHRADKPIQGTRFNNVPFNDKNHEITKK